MGSELRACNLPSLVSAGVVFSTIRFSGAKNGYLISAGHYS